jgi:HSP20 family molecular chaperone IbpA
MNLFWLKNKNNIGFDSKSLLFDPQLNIQEKSTCYQIEIELKGVKREDFEIFFDDGYLLIQEESTIGPYQLQSTTDPFCQAIPMPPDIDIDNVNVELNDGILLIEIKKLKNVLILRKSFIE